MCRWIDLEYPSSRDFGLQENLAVSRNDATRIPLAFPNIERFGNPTAADKGAQPSISRSASRNL